MPSSRVLAVDCGASHAVCGAFTASGGQLILEKFAFESFSADPAQEAEWPSYVSVALREVAKRTKLTGPSILGAPGHLTLTKLAKTPSIEESKRAKILEFEAQQNIPYPLSEVVWDHFPISDDGIDLEVLLAALKNDIATRLCDEARAATFPPTTVEPSCLALYHAFRYNYPEVMETVLLLNIGARSTHLIFIEPKRFQIRTITLAGNTVTQAIADELKEGFGEAEAFKVQALSGQVELPDGSPGVSALNNAVFSFIGKLQLEITRSTVNYRRQPGAEAPTCVYITGGASLIPDFAQLLSERLRMRVEVYEPLRNVQIGAGAAGVEAYAPQMADLVGLATGLVVPTQAQMNLLPREVRAAQQFRKRQPALLGAAVLIGAALVPPILHFRHIAEVAQAKTSQLDDRMFPLRLLDRRMQTNLEAIEQAKTQMASIDGLVRSKSNWLNFFNDLQQRLTEVEDVWLENLQVLRADGRTSEGYGAGGGGGDLLNLAPATAEPTIDEATGEPIKVLRLQLTGRLLDRNNPVSGVSQDSYNRVTLLLSKFTESQFIARVENERFDNTQPGILRFDFILVVDPQKPL